MTCDAPHLAHKLVHKRVWNRGGSVGEGGGGGVKEGEVCKEYAEDMFRVQGLGFGVWGLGFGV